MQLNVGPILEMPRVQALLIITTTASTQYHQTHQHNYHYQWYPQYQPQQPTWYNPILVTRPPPISLLQGAKVMEEHTYAHYELFIGKWILSNETDVPGPFDPLDLDLLLLFLQNTTFNYNYISFVFMTS